MFAPSFARRDESVWTVKMMDASHSGTRRRDGIIADGVEVDVRAGKPSVVVSVCLREERKIHPEIRNVSPPVVVRSRTEEERVPVASGLD